MIQYFNGCTTKDELKTKYRELVKKYHPDLNPNIDDKYIKEINAEYDKLYTRALQGIPFDFEVVKKKEGPIAIDDIHIAFFINDKETGGLYHTDIVKHYSFGMRWQDRDTIKISEELKKKYNLRAGFVAYKYGKKDQDRFDDRDNRYSDVVPVDKKVVPMNFDEVVSYLRDHILKNDMSYLSILDYRILTEHMYYVSSWAGEYYIINTSGDDEALVKVDNRFYKVKVYTKHLHPDKTEIYNLIDMFCMKIFGDLYSNIFEDFMFGLTSEAAWYFTEKDIDKQWPTDPTIAYYMNRGVLKFFVHGTSKYLCFDKHKLFTAIIESTIDKEDLEEIFDLMYDLEEKIHEKFLADVKKGRIKIKI